MENMVGEMGDDDPLGYFERLYVAAERGDAVVPWDRDVPGRFLLEWAQARGLDGDGRRAIVVGCGPGADAEYVAACGYDTVAFDVAPGAIRAARRRFPASSVQYLTADLFDLPAEWQQAFDLVVESLTVQSLPVSFHRAAIDAVAGLVAPGGTLIVVAAVRDERDGDVDGPPWPLTRAEIDAFAASGLRAVRIEQLGVPGEPSERRWRAELQRPD
jgi:SAM-dependent methyltransferase